MSKDSIHIWYEPREEGADSSELAIDINTWKLRSKVKSKYKRYTYLDFGLKIMRPSLVRTLFFYLPYEIEKDKIIDLGYLFRSKSIFYAVFNKPYIPEPDGKRITITKRKRRLDFGENANCKESFDSERKLDDIFEMYAFDLENNDVIVTHKYGGTIISFPVNDASKNNTIPFYIRFRVIIDDNGSSVFFREDRPKYSFFEKANNISRITEITDIRINEYRNQNDSLLERIEKLKKFSVVIIRYFLILPDGETLQNQTELHYQRQLEKDGYWDNYLNVNSYEEMSVYTKFVKKEPNEITLKYFNVFYKTYIYHEYDWRTIFQIITYTLLFTILCSFISDGVKLIAEESFGLFFGESFKEWIRGLLTR